MKKYVAIKPVITLACIFFLSTNGLFAQQVTFKKMFPNDVFNGVPSITQDAQGNMWFSSGNGLVSYNGYTLTYYNHDAINPNSLGGIRVEVVYADREGIIWIGFMSTGLDRLDPATGTFTHYRHNPKDSNSIASDYVAALLEDKDGNFWVGTHHGLDKLDKKTGRFKHFMHKDNDDRSLSNNQVRVLYQDREGTLWIGTGSPWIAAIIGTGRNPDEVGVAGEGGLNKMDMQTGKFTRYLNDPKNPNTLINNKVRAILEDKEGNFWVGTSGDGLHIMDRKTGGFQRFTYDPKHPEKLSRSPINKSVSPDQISFITQDSTGAIWIGTYDGGISRYDEQNKTIEHYTTRDSTSGFNGAGDGVFSECISRDGILWITGLSGNIYTIHPNSAKVPYTKQGVAPFAFFAVKDNSLYMGTNTGLIKKNLTNASVKKFPIKNFIGHIDKDNNNNLWIASFGTGVYKLNLATDSLTNYHHIAGTKNSLLNDSVYAVSVDREQQFWIGTINGLDRLDPNTGLFRHFQHDPNDSNSINSNNILCLMQDRNKNLWIGYNLNGLDKMDIRTGKCKNYLPGGSVLSLIESNDGTVWIGSSFGLFKYNAKAENFISVMNPMTGKYFPSILSITEDQQNNLWLESTNGLIKFNDKNLESSVYGKNAGVDPGALTVFSGYKDNSGRLYFGDTLGYYSFYPKDIETKSKPPQISFTGFSLGNREVEAGSNSVLTTEIWKTKAIELKYNQNLFSFEYTPIDYNDPLENKTMYKLENYDNEWRIATNPEKAYYFNVPPGKYIFRVKAVNSLGAWSEKSIAITILPPWWQTWWAYCLYALFLIIVGYLVYKYQRHYIINKERQRTQQKELAQAKEIEKAYTALKATQAQLIQSEKMASLGELTAGIAHEIQNPLNFVNNFSEVNRELIEELKAEAIAGNNKDVIAIADDISANEEKIIHHGKRADAIVKGMLQHSRSSSGDKEPTDINALADEYLRLSYHGLRAKDKDFNATMKTDFDSSIGKINIIPQDIGRVLLNLYNNAFYAVNEQKSKNLISYEPTVSVTTKKSDNHVVITVSDNGNGIPQKIVDKIFQPFFTTKPAGSGTGLGLSLSYDIVKTHGGEIKVESKEGEGSTFVIQLPLI